MINISCKTLEDTIKATSTCKSPNYKMKESKKDTQISEKTHVARQLQTRSMVII